MRLSGGWKRLLGGAVVLAALQLVPVDRDNPPVSSDLSAPAAVGEILRGSCYDCHSHETRWPWYAWVAPVSWKVAYDVGEARSELNFSTWRSYRPDKRRRLLEDVLEEVDEDEMPPLSYRLLHPAAPLSAEERGTLRAWILDGAERSGRAPLTSRRPATPRAPRSAALAHPTAP